MITDVLAHGVGGRQDLPVPFSYALVGSVVVLVVSFGAVGWLWRSSRLTGAAAGRPFPTAVESVVDSAGLRWTLRTVGLVLTGFVAFASIAGPDLANNPTATWVYVLFWVGLVPASLLFGPIWRQLNPIRTLHLGIARLMGTDPEHGLTPLPRGLGYWPAAVSLFAFVWMELVAPDRATTPVIRTFFIAYFTLHLLAATVFGSRWLDRGDGFEVYSSLVGLMSPFGRREDGRLVVRNPFNGLDSLAPAAGLVAVVSVLLGSTAYDGFSNSPFWVRTTVSSDLQPEYLGTLGLLGFVVLAFVTFWVFTALSGARPTTFVHSIIPIAVGYVVAHYFSLFIFEGQRALILASDPLVDGSNWFGTAERGVDFGVVSATTIAVVQVVAIVVGHVIGVVAAHDRAVRIFPASRAVASQLPLLVLMICYTLGGLLLLFAG